jgi:hypothetical protein
MGICEEDESPEATGVEVVTGAAGVFTAGDGASPRQVVVIALSGCAQLITPSIVSGISVAPIGLMFAKRNELLRAIEERIVKILFIG